MLSTKTGSNRDDPIFLLFEACCVVGCALLLVVVVVVLLLLLLVVLVLITAGSVGSVAWVSIKLARLEAGSVL